MVAHVDYIYNEKTSQIETETKDGDGRKQAA
jgi:hypothetical protein